MAKPPKDAKLKAGAGEPAPRRNGARDVGALLPDVGGVAFRRFGFVQAELIARWRDVVGPVYARWSTPEQLSFPRRQSGGQSGGARLGGTLTVRVEGPFALQLQHVVPQIIERANRILGAGQVARVKLVQGEVPRPAARQADPPKPVGPPPASLARVKDEGLRLALEELAAQLASRPGPPKIG